VHKITNSAVIHAARAVLDAHILALNASDEDALVATLHFPNYILTGGALKTWDTTDDYFDDFRARAGGDWHLSSFDEVAVIHASIEKVHLDICVNRFRVDDSLISQFKTIWVMAFIDGRWAAQLRSVFSPI
jgi:hypothetical protein